MDSNLTIIWLCNSMCTDFRRCGEIDEEMKQKLNEMYVGRLIHILSHTMKRHNPAEVMENDDLTTMQKHVLKFILLETMHRDLYQKDIEEEFQIRKPTVTGILKLMEKNGYIYREGQDVEEGSRHRQIPDFRHILDRLCYRHVTMLTDEDRVTFAPPPRDLLDLILTKRVTSALSDCGILVGRHVRNGAAVHRGHHDFLEDT